MASTKQQFITLIEKAETISLEQKRALIAEVTESQELTDSLRARLETLFETEMGVRKKDIDQLEGERDAATVELHKLEGGEERITDEAIGMVRKLVDDIIAGLVSTFKKTETDKQAQDQAEADKIRKQLGLT